MSESLQRATEKISRRVANKPPFGHTVKIVLTDAGVIYMDGSAEQNVVTNDDRDADLTMESTVHVMQEIDNGDLDAFSAYMQGKLSIEGDQSIAIAFGSLLDE